MARMNVTAVELTVFTNGTTTLVGNETGVS